MEGYKHLGPILQLFLPFGIWNGQKLHMLRAAHRFEDNELISFIENIMIVHGFLPLHNALKQVCISYDRTQLTLSITEMEI